MSTLRELIEDAISKIDLYKHPDIDEAYARLQEVVTAAGMGMMKNEVITVMYIDGERLSFTTEWSARGCLNSSDYSLPISIVDATDPVEAARVFQQETKVAHALTRVRDAARDLSAAHKALEALVPSSQLEPPALSQRTLIGYTWTQASGKHRSVGASPHPSNSHNLEPIFFPLGLGETQEAKLRSAANHLDAALAAVSAPIDDAGAALSVLRAKTSIESILARFETKVELAKADHA